MELKRQDAADELKENSEPDHRARRARGGRLLVAVSLLLAFYLIAAPMLVPSPTVKATLGQPDASGRISLTVDVFSFGYYAVQATDARVSLSLKDNSTTEVVTYFDPAEGALCEGKLAKLALACLPGPRRRSFKFYLDKRRWNPDSVSVSSAVVSSNVSMTWYKVPLWTVMVADYLEKQTWIIRVVDSKRWPVRNEWEFTHAGR
ncbi:MAG: hypothetical protein ACR2IE_10965 [Candidatus Sumerlaeaceae bacterium]